MWFVASLQLLLAGREGCVLCLGCNLIGLFIDLYC